MFFGINSILDFRLAEGNKDNAPLRDVLKGFADPGSIFRRLADQEKRALNRGEIGRYLVTFLDNHDKFWQPGRFGAGAPADQVIAGIGYLLCALGTTCIYYGTEQGFQGAGNSDEDIREAMFDHSADSAPSLLNTECNIYKEIAKIASVAQTTEPLRFGRMYFRQIASDGKQFGLPYGNTYTLAFSRVLYGREVLVAYNISSSPRHDCVIVDSSLHKQGDTMKFLYGANGGVSVEPPAPDGSLFVRLDLAPQQFVILE